jgi:hypothetical protein
MIYEHLEQLATEGTTDPENLVRDLEDPYKVTRDPRHYLLALSMTCHQLWDEVEPLHANYRDYVPIRIRLDQIPAYEDLILSVRRVEHASGFLFGEWEDFVVDIEFLKHSRSRHSSLPSVGSRGDGTSYVHRLHIARR